MSSHTYTGEILYVFGKELCIKLVCHAEMAVEASSYFAAQILAELLGTEELISLIPHSKATMNFTDASRWLVEHADTVIDKTTLVVEDEKHHPPCYPSWYQRIAPLRVHYNDRWQTDPCAVIREVADELTKLGDALEFADDPELYLTGSLDDLLEELVSIQLSSTPLASACLRFCVYDPRWIASLKVGDELRSTASPLVKMVRGRARQTFFSTKYRPEHTPRARLASFSYITN
jgi:hypothetical protein